jgi:hypothetical protein
MADQQGINSVDLIQAVDKKVEKVRTRTLDLSFNELLDMFKVNEFIIEPDFQRLFRWTEGSQSRFIESLILEMPIPPIFVIEREDGAYELIDGLQRISSYLHFRGEHPGCVDDDTGQKTFLRLNECDIVEELNGFTYDDLPQALKIKLKRNFIRVEILRKESDKRLRYYMFKRLNTGGEKLSDQEIRNCTMRLLDNSFNQQIIDLSKNDDFRNCISNISEEKEEQKYDQELVLRFFAFKNYRYKYLHDVGDFLTEYMERISDPDDTEMVFNYELEIQVFNKTFEILNATLNSGAFASINKTGTLSSRFLSYHYEAFTLGIQKDLNKIDTSNADLIKKLKSAFMEVKKDTSFIAITTGGGKNYAKPLQDRISAVENRVSAIL